MSQARVQGSRGSRCPPLLPSNLAQAAVPGWSSPGLPVRSIRMVTGWSMATVEPHKTIDSSYCDRSSGPVESPIASRGLVFAATPRPTAKGVAEDAGARCAQCLVRRLCTETAKSKRRTPRPRGGILAFCRCGPACQLAKAISG